jgi:hypothetical protein
VIHGRTDVAVIAKEADTRIRERSDYLLRMVRRAIVDDHDFVVFERLTPNSVQSFLETVSSLIGRNADGKERRMQYDSSLRCPVSRDGEYF